MHVTIARLGLWGGALVFLGFGIGFLVVPVQWAALVDIALPTAMARTDLRATYGGFDVGIGVFLALCAARPLWLRPGLTALGLAGAGFGGGRILGMLIEGEARPLMLGFAALEVTTAVVSAYLLRCLSRNAQPAR